LRVLVSRGAADRLAPETIIDSLCTEQIVGVERGKAYLYDEGYHKREYVLELPYRRAMYPADTVTIHDGSVGESFVGRVTAHEIRITQTDGIVAVESTVTVERSDEVI